MGQWWTLVIVSGIGGRLAGRLSMRAETLPELLSATYVTVFSDLIDVVAAVVTIRLIQTIAGFQEASGDRPVIPEGEASPITP